MQDQIRWPPTPESLRCLLHKWMPRDGIFIAHTPLMEAGRSAAASPAQSRSLPQMSPFSMNDVASTLPRPSALLSPSTPASPALRRQRLLSPMLSPMLSPAFNPSDELKCSARLLVVARCPLSALTLMHYCQVFGLWADYEADATGAMGRLSSSRYSYDLVVVEPDLEGDMSGYALCAWWRERQAAQAEALARAMQPAARPDGLRDGLMQSSPSPARLITDEKRGATTEFVQIAETPDPAACAAFGFAYCFAKPFSVRCFATVLQQWLKGKEAS